MTIQRQLVEYQHDDVLLEGYMAWDDAIEGARPGVLISHAWAGRSDFENSKTEDIARLGYVGFALDLYGKGVLGTSKDENSALMMRFVEDRALLQARLLKSLETMCLSEQVSQADTAIMGYCFGGMCALDLARVGTDLKGAISVHGLFKPADNIEGINISAKVLALHGWDDPMVPPDSVLEFATEMTAAGADWQLQAFGNTMHAFTNPQANDPEFGTVYNADADKRSTLAIEHFLEEIFTL